MFVVTVVSPSIRVLAVVELPDIVLPWMPNGFSLAPGTPDDETVDLLGVGTPVKRIEDAIVYYNFAFSQII